MRYWGTVLSIIKQIVEVKRKFEVNLSQIRARACFARVCKTHADRELTCTNTIPVFYIIIYVAEAKPQKRRKPANDTRPSPDLKAIIFDTF